MWVSSLSRWYITSLYIYHFLYAIDFSSEKCEMINRYIMMQYTIRINSIAWSGDCCQFEFGRVIIKRWLSNFLLQKQPKLFSRCLWAYCDKNLPSIYPECNISLLGVKWFKFLSHMHSTLHCFCVAFATQNRMSCRFVSKGGQYNQGTLISKIESMQYNWGTLSVHWRVSSKIKAHYLNTNEGVQ